MYRMKKNNSMDIQHRNRQNSDAEMTNYSGPLTKKGGSTGSKKSARFNIPGETTASTSTNSGDDAYVEITLEVSDDAVAVHSVKAAGGGEIEEPELALLARGFEKKSSMVRNASSRIKHFSQELKRLASFTRRPPVGKYDRTKSAAAHALMGLKFISKTDGAAGWAAVADRYAKLTTDKNGLPIGNGLLPRSLFWKCIGMNESSKAFAEELFDAMARRRSINVESLSLHQLKDFWEQMSDQSFDTRLQTFFDMVDKDADGRISEEEVKEIISLSASANSLSKIQNQADEYAALIMEELDPNNKGYILLENLEMLLLQAPHTAKQVRGESKVLSQMLSQKLKPTLDHNVVRRWYEEFRYFLVDNWQRAWVLVLWIGVMAGLFAYKYIQYKNRAAYDVMGACVSLAKGGAETTKLNMALILLPVCRNTITWLRNKTRLGAVVPFDDNLNFHKVIAVAIALGAGIHAISHLTCDFPRLIHASEEKYEPMIQYFGEQPENYWHFVKSVEGVTGIIMVVLMAIAFTLASPWFRRSRLNLPSPLKRLTGFNAFWYSHHLFVIVYALLIVHGEKLYLTKQWYKRTTWMYLVVPLALYAGERLTRALRSSVKPVSILKVAVYPGNVLALHMSKPQGFKYKSGQYMFVNCPAVSPFEWHPFSITSAPRDDYLSVHIRTLGDWTRQMRLVFSQVCREPETGKSGLLRFEPEHLEGTSDYSPNFPKVMIDGPYGAPAQDYKKYDVVLLVGLGIGATPMISIVKDIVNNMKAIEEEEQALENGTASTPPNGSPLSQKRKGASSAGGGNFRTKRAYFYWITREQGSFDWFKGIMNEVAETDKKGVIEMHNYCTSVYEEGDARSALITMLQSLNHAKNGVDVVSGTRVKSHFAKPNWRNVYKRIALNHKDQRVGVFYCGAPGLTNELRQLATDFTRKSDTKFDFHKENF